VYRNQEIILEEVRELEGVKGMPYTTSFERIGMRKMVLEALDERFGEVPDEVSNAVVQIDDSDKLKSLHRQAIRCASLEDFKKALPA